MLTQDIGGHEDAMTGGAHQEVEDDEEEVVGDEGHSHGRRHLQDGRDHQRLLTANPTQSINNGSTEILENIKTLLSFLINLCPLKQ